MPPLPTVCIARSPLPPLVVAIDVELDAWLLVLCAGPLVLKAVCCCVDLLL